MARVCVILLALLSLGCSAQASAATYTVRPGDTLSKIAKVYYGDSTAYGRIYEANRDQVSNVNRIFPGIKLRIPIAVKDQIAAPSVPTDWRARKIDVFFAQHRMPLQGYGSKFVAEADKNHIDWRLLAAISVKESYGGCRQIRGNYNPFGWESGLVRFADYDKAITFISQKLGSGKYYKEKSSRKAEDL